MNSYLTRIQRRIRERIQENDRRQTKASFGLLAALFVALLVALLVAAGVWAQGQVATNVGEDAKKFSGDVGVPIHPDQKLELAMKIKQPFTVVAVGDLLEFQPFTKIIDPDIQYVVNIMRNADVTTGDLENEDLRFR